ncbi:MAG TPA: VCBS repeat-containing protein [Gemmatimonadaceae bacterium]|nr:VCBS repeat-containing protein [Gemmatimonadaceae bacterium]
MKLYAALALGGLLATACQEQQPAPPPLFELLDSARTGVTFVNFVPETPEFNIVNFLYYYNGGGVAVGDVNNDGLQDLYFSSNLGANHLYINRGNYRFEDVTARAGVAGPPGWKTGVTMADVNGDGFVDIYVCAVNYLTMRGHNVLYINNGDGTFTDRTAQYGLDFEGYATQALFFDYDGDGDLDMYLLNNSTHGERALVAQGAAEATRNPRVSDRLYRNDGGHFTDVSARAGIHAGIDYGLGVVSSDFNVDGCPDLYVANDFQENDYLYVNNCDGTFRDSITTATGHTSQYSMGVDAADVNNDLRSDVFVADMLSDRAAIRDSSVSFESWELYARRLAAGYHPQFSRNTLLLNRGALRFSDIAPYAGVAATDWSWAPLLADYDNDGRKDVFVTSGIYRRPNDRSYIAYVSNPAIQTALSRNDTTTMMALLRRMPHVAIPNHAFRNEGNLRFRDVAAAWGLAQEGFSNGAAYVDLTNSGRLDLVVNRINAPAAIYANRRAGAHYLTVQLRGTKGNSAGIGAKVILSVGGDRQVVEQQPTRGFQSSVDPRLHFGLGSHVGVDTLSVIWPDRRMQTLTHVASDRMVALDESQATARWRAEASPSLFYDVTAEVGLTYRHQENDFVDFTREPEIPHVLSAEGPALAVADVDGDGLDDVYVGGAKWKRGALFVQQHGGTFSLRATPAIANDSLSEDVDATFFDANGDGHPDLYVVSGGNEFADDDRPLQDRLYLNDGRGGFVRDTAALPTMRESGSCVAAGDFNGDGHPDVFVGRRAVARHYGVAPRSYLLVNDGHGHFHDVADSLARGLSSAGMVTGCVWLDYDGDGRLDLVVVGEWMAVRVFHQEGGKLVDRTRDTGFGRSVGWWSSVAAADVNGDGRTDLVLGNAGLNSMRVVSGDTTLASVVALNTGGAFRMRELPALAQLAPINAALAGDVDGDGVPDLIVAGNLFGVAPVIGRMDASYGLLLRGASGGNFAPVEIQQSGIDVDGQVRHMARVRTATGYLIVIARNNDSVKVLRRR